MPEVCFLLVGASIATPLLLFGILAWNAIERGLEFAAKEQRVLHRAPARGRAAPVLAALVARPPASWKHGTAA